MTETQQHEMLRRVKTFGDEHRALVARSAVAPAQFAIVETAVARLDEHAVAKLDAAQATGVAKASARAAVRDALAAIRRTARVVAPAATGEADAFRRPRVETDRALLAAGRLMLQHAETHAAAFVKNDLPPTFIADLRARLECFEGVIDRRESKKNDLATVGRQIKAVLASGMAAVQTLDALMPNVLRADPLTLERWRHDRHVRAGRRARAAGEAESSEAAPAVEGLAPSTPAASQV